MNRQRLLWILVAANILVAFSSVSVEGFFGWTMPAALEAYRHARFVESPFSSPGDAFRFAMLATTTLCAFASWIGLLCSWKFARRLYLVSMAMSVFLLLISGPLVVTPIGAALRMVDGLLSGAVLGLIYFSDLARQFERGPAVRTAAATRATSSFVNTANM